jgi:hypothetical protein
LSQVKHSAVERYWKNFHHQIGQRLKFKKSKIKLYKALIRPVVVYGSKCWTLTENIKQKLLVFEKRILRRIFVPTQKAGGEWRLKTN